MAPETQEVPAPMPPQTAPTESAAASAETASGSIPDVITPPGEGRETEGSAEEVVAADTPKPEGLGNVVANFGLGFSQPRKDLHSGSKHDPAVSGVAVGTFSQPSGKAVSFFGAESYEPAFTGVSFAFAGGKCTISGKLDPKCPWGTDSGGRTDVPSATDAVVTKAKWPDIKADLEPGPTTPFKSRRTKYYSQSLVEKHEKFHGTEDNSWTSASGLGIVKTFIEAGTIAPGAGANAAVTALLDGARTKLISENGKWYKGGGASHDSYKGEIDAYADGKASYKTLADAVEAHGKTLP